MLEYGAPKRAGGNFRGPRALQVLIMADARNGSGAAGFIEWADTAEAPARPRTNGHAAPADPPEVRLALAEARLAAASLELNRVESQLRAAQAEADGERRLRESAEQAQRAAEQRLGDTREAFWRWLVKLARTPWWRLRRALASPPPEMQNQRLLTAKLD